MPLTLPTDTAGLALVLGVGGYVALGTCLYVRQLFTNSSRAGVRRHALPDNHDGSSKSESPGVLKKIAAAGRMLLCPVATIGVLWWTRGSLARVLGALPPLFKSYGSSLRDVMPVYVHTKLQAFQLGEAYSALSSALQSASIDPTNTTASAVESVIPSQALAAVLKQATDIVGRNVSLAELLRLPADVAAQDAERGVASRVLGMFSLVNIVWLLSMLGMSALLLPFLYQLLAPLRRLFWMLWEDIIWPTLVALKPVYEPVLYYAAYTLVVESNRFPKTEVDTTGTMVGLSGLGLFAASWCYSTYLHSTGGGDLKVWGGLSGLLFAAASAPVAVMHNSSLIGYATVVSLVSALGFTAFGMPLCICIGFRGRTQTLQTCVACLFMTLGSAVLRACGVSIGPFESAVNVFGTAVYFLALSILSVTEGGYGQLLYVANLVAYVTMGTLLGMPGLKNAALTWGAIETLVMGGYYMPKKEAGLLIIGGFLGCCATYAGSLYLSMHPELVTAMVTGSAPSA